MDRQEESGPSKRSQRGLDWLAFFIADVQTAFGPFVAVYLIAGGWSQGQIGLLLTIGGLTSIASQIPGGALVDAAGSKRVVIAVALAMIAAGALIFALFRSPAMIFVAEVLHGSTSGMISPALAAIGLGLVGQKALSGRLGRNHRFNSLGNGATAAAMGVLGHFVAKWAPFLVAAGLCLPAAFALTRIRGEEIDYATARSARDRSKPREVARLRELSRNRRLIVFVAALLLFQLANASMVPLATERLGQQHGHASELFTSGLVVVPQAVTALIAAWVARQADEWGRRPLLLAGFGVLPIRAVLFMLVPGPWYLVGIQTMAGLTAAIIGIMTPLVVADVTRGTGRYNVAQGLAGTATGLGASLSTVGSGYVAQGYGYAIGFAALAIVGALGLAAIYFFLPETAPQEPREGARPLAR